MDNDDPDLVELRRIWDQLSAISAAGELFESGPPSLTQIEEFLA